MEARRTTAFIAVKNQLLFFEIQPFLFGVGLGTLELAHRVNGDHFIAD